MADDAYVKYDEEDGDEPRCPKCHKLTGKPYFWKSIMYGLCSKHEICECEPDKEVIAAWSQHRVLFSAAVKLHWASDLMTLLSLIFSFLVVPLTANMTSFLQMDVHDKYHLSDNTPQAWMAWPRQWQIMKIGAMLLPFLSGLLVATMARRAIDEKWKAGYRKCAQIVGEIYRYRMHVGAYSSGDASQLTVAVGKLVGETVGKISHLKEAQVQRHVHYTVIRPKHIFTIVKDAKADDFISDLSRDTYLRYRVEPFACQHRHNEKRMHRWVLLLRLLSSVGAVASIALVQLDKQALVPTVIAFSSMVTLWTHHTELPTRALAAKESAIELKGLSDTNSKLDDAALVDSVENEMLAASPWTSE